MTREVSFISAGEDEKEAISFLLKFVEEKFLELATHESKINLRCNDAAQASELNQKLWEDLDEVFLAHKISNDTKIPSCPVEISYPGIKVKNDFSTLINLNPKLPPDYLDYDTVFQIVIKDNASLQNQARESFKQCKIDGLDPTYIN
tara:strand:+ start:1996 stop:2436 length:441 start_codon:yes stop_codon:yes gene_type:complete